MVAFQDGCVYHAWCLHGCGWPGTAAWSHLHVCMHYTSCNAAFYMCRRGQLLCRPDLLHARPVFLLAAPVLAACAIWVWYLFWISLSTGLSHLHVISVPLWLLRLSLRLSHTRLRCVQQQPVAPGHCLQSSCHGYRMVIHTSWADLTMRAVPSFSVCGYQKQHGLRNPSVYN